MEKDISYVRIPGQYDVITTRTKSPYYIFTAKGGIVNIFKWQYIEGEDNRHNRCNIYHKYQLFVSIEISSSSVLTIRTSKPLFRLHLHYPTRVFFIDENTFILITNDGSIRCITQQINKNNIKFNQTSNKQLNFKCSRLFTSILTIHFIPSLIILADDEHSLGIYRSNDIIYMNIDLSQYSSTRLLSMTTDIYCLKNNCLATIINDKNRLNLYNIHSCVCHEPIQLENEYEQLCLNESGDYVFALVKPRILCMHRVIDRFQLGRLFVYDFVTRMIVSYDFIVLAMNDRRLLTLMIADPDDSTLQTKIQALPSRQFKQDSYSTNDEVIKRIEKFMNVISDDSDNEIENDQEMNDKQLEIYNKTKVIQPITSYRYVRRVVDSSNLVIDDSEVDDDDDIISETQSNEINSSIEQEYNLDDIRAKTLEHNRQQVKGIQLANADANNLKIINS
ncbi:unnamed protein product [Rotaria sordida]|nr:unnamed protein product [Rotaria sordida]